MLLQFKAKNYKSFKEESVLSMIAGSGKEHEEELIHWRDKKILPAAVIYGANASGKSNFMEAFTASLMTVRESSSLQIGQPLIRISPFLFDDSCTAIPSEFSYIFTVGNTRYDYSFSADRNRIHEETLYAYYSTQPSLIFSRKNTNEYHFTSARSREYSAYKDKTADNKLFLAAATAWNCKETREPYMYLSDLIDTFHGDASRQNALQSYENDTDNSLKEFSLDFLHHADINISDYTFKSRIVQPEEYSSDPFVKALDQVSGSHGVMKQYDVRTIHTVQDAGKVRTYQLPFSMESEGTQSLFYYAPYLKEALEKGKTIIIDEMDRSLHPLLARYLVEMFQNPDINTKGAQLIFNTHDVSLLNLELFRRDQIYFIEKNNDTAVSDIYSLDEFSPRKTENVAAGYMLGKYGAVPYIGEDNEKR